MVHQATQLLLVSLRDRSEQTFLHSASRRSVIVVRISAIRKEVTEMFIARRSQQTSEIIAEGVLVLFKPSLGRVFYFGCVVSENEAVAEARVDRK